VRDALATVEAALDGGDARSVVALGSIVHNPQAQERLAVRGLTVERDPARVAAGARLVVTAHGAPPAVFEEAARRGLEVVDTTCPVVTRRQRDGGHLVEEADVIVVVGGRSSANTRALAETCAARRPTYHVETPDEVRREWFSPGQRIGIASGTSTPDWLVDAVDQLCRSF